MGNLSLCYSADWLPDYAELQLDWGNVTHQQVHMGAYDRPVKTYNFPPYQGEKLKILTPRTKNQVVMPEVYDGTTYQYRVRELCEEDFLNSAGLQPVQDSLRARQPPGKPTMEFTTTEVLKPYIMLVLPQGDVTKNPMIAVLITNTEISGNYYGDAARPGFVQNAIDERIYYAVGNERKVSRGVRTGRANQRGDGDDKLENVDPTLNINLRPASDERFILQRIYNASNPNPNCWFNRILSRTGPEIRTGQEEGRSKSGPPTLALSGERIFLGEVPQTGAPPFFEEGCQFEIYLDRCSVHTSMWPHKCQEFDFFLPFLYIETPPYFQDMEAPECYLYGLDQDGQVENCMPCDLDKGCRQVKGISFMQIYLNFDIWADFNITLTGINPPCEVQWELLGGSASWSPAPGQRPVDFIPLSPDCETSSFFNESVPFVEQPMKYIVIDKRIKDKMQVKFNNLSPGTEYRVSALGWERNRFWVPTELMRPGEIMQWPTVTTHKDISANLKALRVHKKFLCPNGFWVLFQTDIILTDVDGRSLISVPTDTDDTGSKFNNVTHMLISVTVADYERTCAQEGLITPNWKFPKLRDNAVARFRFELEPELETPFEQLEYRGRKWAIQKSFTQSHTFPKNFCPTHCWPVAVYE